MSRRPLQRFARAELEDGLAELEPDEDELSCYLRDDPDDEAEMRHCFPEVVSVEPDDRENDDVDCLDDLACELSTDRFFSSLEEEHAPVDENELDDADLFPEGEDPVFSAT